VVKNIAAALYTTVGYSLVESKKHEVLKDTAMLKRLNDIASFPDEDKKHILSPPTGASVPLQRLTCDALILPRLYRGIRIRDVQI